MGHISVGIGLREPYIPALRALRDRSALDVLEVMVDDVLDDRERLAQYTALGARWPLIAHGVALGPGDAMGVNGEYVRRVGAALDALRVHWYSDHLCFLRAPAEGGVTDLGHFVPLSFDDEELGALAECGRRVRDAWRGPFLLENPADILGFEGHGEEAAVRSAKNFSRALSAAESGALLDVTNLALQGRNDGFDPSRFLREIPWDRVMEVHLAGGRKNGALWVDSHDHPVDDESWSLLAQVVARAPNLRAVIIERDERLPKLDELLGEVERAKKMVR